MKSSLLILMFLIIHNPNEYSDKEIKSCKTFENTQYLNQTEKDVLYFINLARINPQEFSKAILKPYIEKHKEHSKKYSRSLMKDLKKGVKLSPLKPQKDLYSFAKYHAKSTGKKGKVGHRSAKGKSYKNRTKDLIKKYTIVGENIHYGSNNALEIVIDLLIDDGIKDVGHRINILTKNYEFCSVSIQKHKKYKYNCVIEFSGKKI